MKHESASLKIQFYRGIVTLSRVNHIQKSQYSPVERLKFLLDRIPLLYLLSFEHGGYEFDKQRRRASSTKNNKVVCSSNASEEHVFFLRFLPFERPPEAIFVDSLQWHATRRMKEEKSERK